LEMAGRGGGGGGGGIRQTITFTLDFIAVSCFRLNSTSLYYMSDLWSRK